MLTDIRYHDEAGVLSTVTVDMSNATPRALTPFVCHQASARQWWLLDADFLWFDGEHALRIRRGYGWNGASVPAAAQWYEDPAEHLAASCFHDAGHTYHWFEVWDAYLGMWVLVDVGKSYVDGLFFSINERFYQVRVAKCCVLWTAVRLGGWCAWWSGVCPRSCSICPARGPGEDCPYRDNFPITKATWRMT